MPVEGALGPSPGRRRAEARTTNLEGRGGAASPLWRLLARLSGVINSAFGGPIGAAALLIVLDLLTGRVDPGRWIMYGIGAVVSVPLAILGRCHHLPGPLAAALTIPPFFFLYGVGLPAPIAGLAALMVLGASAILPCLRRGTGRSPGMIASGVLVLTEILWPALIVQSVAAGAERPGEVGAFGVASLVAIILGRQWWLSHHPLAPGEAVPAGGVLAVIIPVHNEAPTIGSVVRGVPRDVIKRGGHEVAVIVVDDGSTDGSGAIARAAGADLVIRHPDRRGLGAALRTGLLAARHLGAGAAVYLDGDGEYDPRDIPAVAGPVLRGEADYVLGSRFPAAAGVMRPGRRIGNRAFTVLVGLLTGRRIADAQTGCRAFSARALAEAEIVHDYNYAQVLTLDLLRKRQRLAQVPISYRVRRQGRSFIRYREYPRRVLPAMIREILAP